MTARHSGTFPPNCLFRLKRVIPKEVGFVHEPTSVRVMQQLLVVSATYLPPQEEVNDEDGGSKYASTTFLNYASRNVRRAPHVPRTKPRRPGHAHGLPPRSRPPRSRPTRR